MTLAADVHFQVYLLDGIHRWNQNRDREALRSIYHMMGLSAIL